MEQAQKAQLSPGWKQAVAIFISLDPQPGFVITREWLDHHFSLEKPISAEEYKAYALEFMSNMARFTESLLVDHQIAIRSLGNGRGWAVIPPEEQSKWVWGERMKRMKRELKKLGQGLIHVKHDQLSTNARRENADLLAKTSMLRGMVKEVARREMGFKVKKTLGLNKADLDSELF
jgi:hypothetical protein